MKITADTNMLVRAITGDDERQSRAAQAQLAKAEMMALPLPVLCELIWVLSQGYKISSVEIAETVRPPAVVEVGRASRGTVGRPVSRPLRWWRDG